MTASTTTKDRFLIFISSFRRKPLAARDGEEGGTQVHFSSFKSASFWEGFSHRLADPLLLNCNLSLPKFFVSRCGGPLSWDKQLRHSSPFDENCSTGKTTLQHIGARLVKRRRALLESNSPRNSRLETHRDDGWGGSRSRPQASPAREPHRTIDFRMPEKTHKENCRAAATFLAIVA